MFSNDHKTYLYMIYGTSATPEGDYCKAYDPSESLSAERRGQLPQAPDTG